jgi:hypothetical protein
MLGLGTIKMVLLLPKKLIGMADDVGRMAAAVSVLPAMLDQLAVLEQLEAIDAHVDRLDIEVTQMHRAVETMRGDLVGVEGAVGPLAAQLDTLCATIAPLSGEVRAMRGSVERLEPHLEDMSGAVVPLGPAAERLGTIAGRFKRGAQLPPG